MIFIFGFPLATFVVFLIFDWKKPKIKFFFKNGVNGTVSSLFIVITFLLGILLALQCTSDSDFCWQKKEVHKLVPFAGYYLKALYNSIEKETIMINTDDGVIKIIIRDSVKFKTGSLKGELIIYEPIGFVEKFNWLWRFPHQWLFKMYKYEIN